MISNLDIKRKFKKLILSNDYLKRYAAMLYSNFNGNKIHIMPGNSFIKDAVFLKNTKIHIVGQGNTIKIVPGSILNNCDIYIFGNNNSIFLGSKVILSDANLYIEDNNNTIDIGNNTTIHGKTHLACIEGCRISIGTDCMFSTDVVFRTGDSHSIIDDTGNRINKSKDIVIGNHVWFGNKTTILKGAIIRDNSIVATGSIVTNTFSKSNIILAGIPARVVKENINWLRERI
jgi:acetyltransferase-like isoleucine patch superfamily enzyme